MSLPMEQRKLDTAIRSLLVSGSDIGSRDKKVCMFDCQDARIGCSKTRENEGKRIHAMPSPE